MRFPVRQLEAHCRVLRAKRLGMADGSKREYFSFD